MNVQILSSQELETLLKKKVSQERQLTVEVITLLEEVNSRAIFLQRGFGSLIEYCIKELGYSESSAYRRVSAMRVAREIPQVKEAISKGKLNLVTVAKAHSVFKKEAQGSRKALSIEDKSKILETLENKSTRQAEKLLLEISPLEVPKEKVREITRNKTQVSLVLSEELIEKLNEIKNIWSHKNPNPSYAELLKMLANFTLQKLRAKTQSNTNVEGTAEVTAGVTVGVGVKANSMGGKPRRHRAYIPQALKRKIWQKANNRCEYKDPFTGRECESRFRLQIEHVQPVAKGGTNDETNLELLCQAHNSLRAIQHFGWKQIEKFHQ